MPEAGEQVRDGETHLKSNFGFMGTLIIFSMRIQICSFSLFLEINVQLWVFLHIKSESLMKCCPLMCSASVSLQLESLIMHKVTPLIDDG